MNEAKRSRWLPFVALAAAALAPRAAVADATVDISFGGESRFPTSSSMDAVSADSSHGILSLAAGYHAGPIVPFGDVVFELGLGGGRIEGATFERVRTEMHLLELVGSARLSRPLIGSLRAFARGGIGMRRLDLRLRQGDDGLSDRGWGPLASAGAGLEYTPLRPGLGISIGYRLEAGYVYHAAESMSAEPQSRDDDRVTIPSSSAPLGSLDAGGWMLRGSVVARF